MPVIEPSDLKNVINAGVNAGAKDQCLPSLKQKEIGKKGNFSSICFFLLDIQNLKYQLIYVIILAPPFGLFLAYFIKRINKMR